VVSVGIGLVGLFVALSSKIAGRRARAAIVLSVAVAAAAVIVALGVLGTFNWA
jgi:hypothetical protein